MIPVSWRPSVAEVVWKAAPAATCIPFHLYTTHSTQEIQFTPWRWSLYCVCQVSTTRICKNHWWSFKPWVLNKLLFSSHQGVVGRSRYQLLVHSCCSGGDPSLLRDAGAWVGDLQGMGKSLEQSDQGKTTKSFSFWSRSNGWIANCNPNSIASTWVSPKEIDIRIIEQREIYDKWCYLCPGDRYVTPLLHST